LYSKQKEAILYTPEERETERFSLYRYFDVEMNFSPFFSCFQIFGVTGSFSGAVPARCATTARSGGVIFQNDNNEGKK
jgi:hypothetical protein